MSHISDRELDILVARKLFGMNVRDVPFVPTDLTPDVILTDEAMAVYRQTFRGGASRQCVPYFSTDYATVREVRDLVAAVDMEQRFIDELNREFAMDLDLSHPTHYELWAILNVSPRLQCIAALRALGHHVAS